MKRTLAQFICGILMSVLILEGTVRAISPLLGPPLTKWNTMEDAKILKLDEFRLNHPRPSYVFMGNSTSLIGLNPSVFDANGNLPSGSSFNAAMNGSEIRQIRDFACGYIIREIKPKNLVILFSNVTMATNTNHIKLDTESTLVEKYSYIYRYRNTFRDPMTLNTFLRVATYRDMRQGLVYRWADNLDEFGYTKYKTTESAIETPGWDPSQIKGPNYSQLSKIDRKGFKYLEEIRDLTRANGGALIIGTVPTLSFDANYRGSIEMMARQLGVTFVQGNDALGQGRYFQDGVHLNLMGATEFSKFMSRELDKLR
jgi:hypothetical protein